MKPEDTMAASGEAVQSATPRTDEVYHQQYHAMCGHSDWQLRAVALGELSQQLEQELSAQIVANTALTGENMAQQARIRELREALEPFAENPVVQASAPCHNGLTSAEHCGRCSRHAKAFTALSLSDDISALADHDRELRRRVLLGAAEVCETVVSDNCAASMSKNCAKELRRMAEEMG